MDIEPVKSLTVIPGIYLMIPVLLILYITGYTNICDIIKYFILMQASTMASMAHLSFPSIPGEFPSSRSPILSTPPPSIYPYPFHTHIPSSHSPLSSHNAQQPSAPALESSVKVCLREAPSLWLQGLKQCLCAMEVKLSTALHRHQQEHKHLAIETVHEASVMQYVQDLEAWEQRASSYKQQPQAQEAYLLKVAASNAAVTRELQGALCAWGEQLASLQSCLHSKDEAISQIQAHCEELSVKLEAV